MKRIFLAILLAACSQRDGAPDDDARDTVTTTDAALGEQPACSAADLAVPLPQPELPEPVARTREEIARAAIACDYSRLEALALADGAAFTYSFGDEDRPAEYWMALEAQGEDPLAMLVKTLSLPWARETLQVEPYVFYVWPSAFLVEATDEDWEALTELYTPEEIATMKEYGSFIGWRVGLTETGGWRFFVAGD